jgi:hypothetical protein
MGLLTVVLDRSTEPAIRQHRRNQALAAAADQGYRNPSTFEWPGGVAYLFAVGPDGGGSGLSVREGDRFALSVGAFHWRGLAGEAALRRLLARDGPIESLPWAELSGSFAMLLGRADGVWLAQDAVGLMKVYEAAAGGVISSSLLLCRAMIERPSVDRFRAQEYILLGANHGGQTPIEGLHIVAPTAARELTSGRVQTVHPPDGFRAAPWAGSERDALKALSESMVEEFAHLASQWKGHIGMALSGGFDSRLLLAALDAVGVRPRLFVYGRTSEEDVVIAGSVAHGLGLPIEAIDKQALDEHSAPLTRAAIAANLRFFDGLPADGVFDRGCDRTTRLKQVEGGLLNLNGGGGEILRNFFYLADGRFSAADIVAAFYSGWFSDVFLHTDDRAAFVTRLQDEILASLGREQGTLRARAAALPRSDVELIYALYRVRYWMGRNNATAARIGAFMTPLVTPGLVRLAASLPLRWKDFGRLESALIHALSPRVAAGPSAYGFSFADGPGRAYRWKTRLTMARPLWLRSRSMDVQRLLGRARATAAPAEWREALGDEPQTHGLDPRALNHIDQVNRQLTLHALLSPLGGVGGS